MSGVVFLAIAGFIFVILLVGTAAILLVNRGGSTTIDPAFATPPPFPLEGGISPHSPDSRPVFPPPIPDHPAQISSSSADSASLSEAGHSLGGTAAVEAASNMESSATTDFGGGSGADFSGGGSDSGSTSSGDGGSSNP